MKKLIFTVFTLIICVKGVYAQDKVNKFGIFDHLSFGVTTGTQGLDFDVAAPVTDYVQVRAGYSFLPNITYKTDVNYTKKGNSYETEIEAKLGISNAKVLIDVYPFPISSFHATMGAYIGTSSIITVKNLQPIYGLNPGEGIEIADYIIAPGDDGIAQGAIKVAAFKPYLGVGFGRSVPRGRVGVTTDFGLQFWGSPGVYEKRNGKYMKIKSSDADGGGLLKIISKITVYPMLTVRVSGRIF